MSCNLASTLSALLIVLIFACHPVSASLELTEVDILTGMIEITNVGDTDVSGGLLEFCIPFVYGALESSSFTFLPGETRVYDMVDINPGLTLNASDDLWIYLDRTGGFGNEQFVTTGVVWGSNQAGSGRVNQVVASTGGEAWADVNDFVDTSALGPGQTLQLIFPGDTPNASSGWTIADANFGFFGEDCNIGSFPDLDCDGIIDCSDFDALAQQISSGVFDADFDLNQDGVLDIGDMDELRTLAGAQQLASGNPYLPGDATLDGVVDGLDFIEWNESKFTATPAWCSGDFNVDGIVDGLDFIIWNENKFQSADSAAVPEPSTLALMMMAALLLRRLS